MIGSITMQLARHRMEAPWMETGEEAGERGERAIEMRGKLTKARGDEKFDRDYLNGSVLLTLSLSLNDSWIRFKFSKELAI